MRERGAAASAAAGCLSHAAHTQHTRVHTKHSSRSSSYVVVVVCCTVLTYIIHTQQCHISHLIISHGKCIEPLHFSRSEFGANKMYPILKINFSNFDPKIFNIYIYTFKFGTQSVRYVIRMEQLAKIKKFTISPTKIPSIFIIMLTS
mgnify:CR=1 FL=1